MELVSTGGTARALREAGLAVQDISELTGFPEMLDGRVKTLHPKVHGGILHIRDNPAHRAAVAEHGIVPIDMVVVNLYAFEKTASKPGVAFHEIIENIDIGGPSMVRSAAKNFEDVAIVTAASDYAALTEELAANHGALSRETRWRLARQAFALTAAYDSAIAAHAGTHWPRQQGRQAPSLSRSAAHQLSAGCAAALWRESAPGRRALLRWQRHRRRRRKAAAGQGTELQQPGRSGRLLGPGAGVHRACWWPSSSTPIPAARPPAPPSSRPTKALATDPVSAFGGVIGVNREIDEAAAEEIAKLFVEAIAAPAFTAGALARFAAKKNLRLVVVKPAAHARGHQAGLRRHAAAGCRHRLGHSRAICAPSPSGRPRPTSSPNLLFAWKVAKHVKSNAIVYARGGQTIGVGAGQMSRVDAARFGAMKAVLPLAGTVAASDAFFPFPDGLETIAEAGATAVIQPGGSVRDDDVIEAADRLGIAMVFTGMRHFRH